MKIRIPVSARKKALLIIDVQPATLNSAAVSTVRVIRAAIRATHYPLYVIAAYHAGLESMFYKQSRWHLPIERAGAVDEGVLEEVRRKNMNTVVTTKSVRSVFKCDQRADLMNAMASDEIAEVHVMGYDINDCVLATAYDALDLGFYTYVIEEACNRNDGNKDLVAAAISVLRQQNMTNHSSLDDHEDIELDIA